MTSRRKPRSSGARKTAGTGGAVAMVVLPQDRPVATPQTARDPGAERWWILDPDGHRELQGRKAGLPPGMQAAGWCCTWCGSRIQIIAAPGAGFDGVLPIPVVEHATLCASCARTVVPDPGRDWDGGCCDCEACQARRRKLGI